MSIETEAAKMKLVSPAMAALPISVRNAALSYIAEGLEENKEKVFAANREDLASAEESGLP
jgi:glutamate-5-semialdehyde dehydrogenase